MAGENENINPIADIDFESLGVQQPFDGNQTATQDPPNEDPEKPEDPNPQDPEDPEGADPDETEDPEDPNEDPDETDDPEDPESGDQDDPADDPDEGDDPDDPDPSDEPEATVVSELIGLVGYDDLDPENYDDSVEGLGNLIQDASNKLANQILDSQLEQNPDAKEYLEYLNNGGDPDKYHEVRNRAADYENIQLEEGNESQHERLIRDDLARQDHTDEEIDNIIDKYKAAGILEDQAEIALKGLQRQTKKQKEQMLEQQKEVAKQQQQEIKQFWDDAYERLKSNQSFKGITVPKKEIDPFFDYISKPVTEEGYTQRDLDAMEMGLDEKFAIDYLIFKGFPLDEIVSKKAKTQNASSLRERIKSGGDPKPRKTNPPKPPSKGGDGSIDQLDLM